jgi:hypothetical protein
MLLKTDIEDMIFKNDKNTSILITSPCPLRKRRGFGGGFYK